MAPSWSERLDHLKVPSIALVLRAAEGQLREWGRPGERVRRTPNNRQPRCTAEDARPEPFAEVGILPGERRLAKLFQLPARRDHF